MWCIVFYKMYVRNKTLYFDNHIRYIYDVSYVLSWTKSRKTPETQSSS